MNPTSSEYISNGEGWNNFAFPEKPVEKSSDQTKANLIASSSFPTCKEVVAKMKERVILPPLHHIEQIADLFESSRKLENQSKGNLLNPLTGDNANDVHITTDVVFKPGKNASTKSNICFGLVRMLKHLENVIPLTKSGQANVVSKEDFNVERTQVFNSEANCSYLIDQSLETITVSGIKKNGQVFEGKYGKKSVRLEPVDGHPGFYYLETIVKPGLEESESSESFTKSEEDQSISSDESLSFESEEDARIFGGQPYSEPEGDTSLEASEEELSLKSVSKEETSSEDSEEQRLVMHISSSLPSEIDGWVNEKTSWIVLKNLKKETFIVPSTKIIEIIRTEKHIFEDEILDLKSTEKRYTNKREAIERFVNINDEEYAFISNQNDNIELFPTGEKPIKTSNDIKEMSKNYALLETKDEKLVLVPKYACLSYKDEDMITHQGHHYFVKKKGEGLFLFSKEPIKQMNQECFIIIEEEDEWLHKDMISFKDGKKYVKRNEQDYEIVIQNIKPKVEGKKIEGMVQLKIENLFTTPEGKNKSLKITLNSPERNAFYNRIHMPSFINAFMAALLLRPEDGKIDDLAESNVLFQEMKIDGDSLLCPILIDLDEAMPSTSETTETTMSRSEVLNIRNGLLGFPQARKKLFDEEKLMVMNCLQEIIEKKKEVSGFLNRSINASFTEKHVNAYVEVVDKIIAFLKEQEAKQEDWTLETLYFYIFPNYAWQWNELGDIDPQKKAIYIGKNTVNDVLKLENRFKKQMQ